MNSLSSGPMIDWGCIASDSLLSFRRIVSFGWALDFAHDGRLIPNCFITLAWREGLTFRNPDVVAHSLCLTHIQDPGRLGERRKR